jgi:hypothetical protein
VRHNFVDIKDGFVMCKKCSLTMKAHFHSKTFSPQELKDMSRDDDECSPLVRKVNVRTY